MAEPISPPVTTPITEEPLPPSASLAPSAGGSDDWPTQATDAVVRVVDSVRDKTTGPAVNAAHATKYGILVALLAVPFGVLGLILLMRFSETVIHNIADWAGATSSYLLEPMWIVYLFYGLIFTLIGRWCWRKANKPAKATAS